MKTQERERLLDKYMNTGSTYELMVREIDRAVRKARREERAKTDAWIRRWCAENANMELGNTRRTKKGATGR